MWDNLMEVLGPLLVMIGAAIVWLIWCAIIIAFLGLLFFKVVLPLFTIFA